MTELKPTVSLTNINSENMSRHQMLEWVNKMCNGQYKKVEELCSGVAYCQMLDMIFPNCINLKRIKMTAKLEHEYFHNLKIFQSALTRLKLDKTIPVDRLIKGRFQDNFEFLQWFKKFFDSQAPGLENMKTAANIIQPKPIKARGFATKQLNEAIKKDISQKTVTMIDERDHAYEKLCKIETLLKHSISQNEHIVFCTRALELLYKNNDGESFGSATADSAESSIDK